MKDHKNCREGACWCMQPRPYQPSHWKELTIEPTFRTSANLLAEGARAVLVNTGRTDYDGYPINIRYH